MDIREKKTKKSITEAFLQLRSKKPLERITVKELASLAEISKATFYLHYRDIYDLSDRLQKELIQNIFASIAHPESCLRDSKTFTRALCQAFDREEEQIKILFSHTQDSVLPKQIQNELLSFFHHMHPEIDHKTEMKLTYSIFGCHYVYRQYVDRVGQEELIDLVCKASDAILSIP